MGLRYGVRLFSSLPLRSTFVRRGEGQQAGRDARGPRGPDVTERDFTDLMPKTVDPQLEAIVEPVCRAHGLELVQIQRVTEHGQAVLRIMIDRQGSEEGAGAGVSLADCQAVSRDLGPALEADEPVGGAYRLEVSSPGVDRPLVKLKDFERFAGRTVKVQLERPLDEGRRKLTGTLMGVDGELVRLEVDGSELQLPHADIAKANVVYEFD
ncbi:MAG: ribosome maturation factor RimP [Myxococcota bacterium]|nr:ribosome maturation factor RimP [Myxococcota bacterium]